jgi:hypothetical protein
MRVLIEEYRYNAADKGIKDVLHGIDALENIDGYVSVNYVGYFYNTDLDSPDGRKGDCVFILPKVLLESVNGRDYVFGKYAPEDIVNLDSSNPLTKLERDFIYEFAVWIYRTIVVFQSANRDTTIVYHKKIAEVGRGRKRLSNTFLDVLLSLVQFNKENQNFFFYVLRNIHSGFNKINWNRTIATTSPIIQGKTAVYVNPVNKKRQINFDEELLVIFFSILDYISSQYGFPVELNCNFQLIRGKQFQTYLDGLGKVRLRQIKYKYFSDKAIQLWELCYAFFDSARQIQVSSAQQEYLLVKNFNIVFEAIIDELIGEPHDKIPAGLADQTDGKRVDHMYSYKGLTTHEENKPIYYIGDSKYYKRGNSIGNESVYKQFTYARNVIQWNLNLFMNDDRSDETLQMDKRNFGNIPKLRDDVTEGYNVIPNFFISARLNKELSYDEQIDLTDKEHTHFNNRHFDNRLFDRDTLLICHYDVNFLYVVSLYARNNSIQKGIWKEKVRAMFRAEIQSMLQERYDFYAMAAHPNEDAKEYIKGHFQQTLGKIFTPFNNKDYYSLALDKEDPEKNNEALLKELRQHFFVEKCNIGEDPTPILTQAANTNPVVVPRKRKDGVLMVMMENYQGKSANFITAGQIAIGIKETSGYDEILKNIDSIGYILFHTRKDIDQHLFALDSNCVVKEGSELDGVYKNISTSSRYLLVSFMNDFELVSTSLHSTNKPNSDRTTRYDSQFAWLDELKMNRNERAE